MNDRESERAPADIINGILTRLVCAELSLQPEHLAELICRRGLSAAEIERERYVSVPATRAERIRVASALAPYLDAFGGGVPGFFLANGRWEMVYRPPGFFIPVRDERGHLQALSQRVDDPGEDGGKYLWFSSADRDGGASSGAPPHFANRHLLSDATEIVIVEGILKSQIVAFLSGAPVVGIAGTCSITGLAARLKMSFPKLRYAVIAYDRDMNEKPHVYEALMRLVGQLEAERFRVRVRTWPGQQYKGFDDYLLAQQTGAAVQAA